MRDAQSLTILPPLIEAGAHVKAHDPEGTEQAQTLLPKSIEYFPDIFEAADGADAVILMTEWNQYKDLDLQLLKNKMKGKIFLDLRNVYEPNEMNDAGFEYYCIGRGGNF